AGIHHIEYAVLIVVGVRAAVIILETVVILELARATIVGVRYAVAVIIDFGAAIGVLESIPILGDQRALVDVVLQPVLVGVLDPRCVARRKHCPNTRPPHGAVEARFAP